MAALEAKAERQRYEAVRLRLFYRVKQAYYEYYYLARAIAVTEETLEQLRYIENIAEARYRAAAASAPDVLRAQVELGKTEDELKSMQDMRSPTAARLNAALNLPSDAPQPWPGEMEDRPAAPSEAEMLAWLRESNPELKAMELDAAKEQQGIGLAGKEYFPDIELGFEYDQMVDAPGVPNDMGMENPMAVMVSVNVPIWWEKYAAGVREAQARYRAACRDKDEKANSLAVELKMAAYNFRNSQRKVELYRDTLLPRARQSLKSIQASYQTAAASFSDLIDAQRILLEFQLSYERSLANRQQSLAELEMLAGRPLAATPVPAATPPGRQQPQTMPAAGSSPGEQRQ